MSYFRKNGTKYNNKKVIVDNIKFDSKKESQYYLDIKDDKEVENLKLQDRILLLPAFVDNQGHKIRKMEYIADFTYDKNGIHYIVDTKGFKTNEYKLKKKYLLFMIKDEKNIIFLEL